jgi:O-antigen ligase
MLAAIVCTKSRSGFLGLIAMAVVLFLFTVRLRPGVVVAMAILGVMALPAAPQSFWNRMDSIVVPQEDTTGSREARVRLLREGLQVFSAHALTGVGAGQFKNYQGPEMVERWRETHDVWLQVAAETGILGFLVFAFMVIRAYAACISTLWRLRRPRRKGRGRPGRATGEEPPEWFTPAERAALELNARAMLTGLVGWTVCSFFASVAYGWTFYFVFALAVAGRDLAAERRRTAEAPAAVPVAARLAGAHA